MSDVDLIADLYVFRTVDRTAIAALVAMAPPQTFAAESVIFRQGEPADRALLVVEGRLEATVEAGGRARRVGEIGPGEIVGEQAIFHPHGPRNAGVAALQASRCLVITPKLMEDGADNDALLAIETYLLGSLARRIRSTNRTMLQAWKEAAPKGPAATVAEAMPTTTSLLDSLRRLFGG